MCGRFGLEHPEWSETRFHAQMLPGIEPETVLIPRFNIAPTQEVLAVAPSKRLHGERGLKSMRWGLTAQWALQDRSEPRPINIKTEDILDRPAYRRLLGLKRCLIVVDGFYEWRKQPGQSKQPYWIGLRSGETFGFAGLWDAVKDGDDCLVRLRDSHDKPQSACGHVARPAAGDLDARTGGAVVVCRRD